MVPLVAVGSAPLDLAALTTAVLTGSVPADAAAAQGTGDGAIASFAGLVRDHNLGRRVRFLEYEAYEPLAIRAMERIVEEARAAWPSARIGLHHRTGRLEIGEASIIIVAASAHRGDAFAACRYAIERVKQIVPIWKREHFEGGDVWLEGAVADPDDTAARQKAYKIACA
ncbi:MAG: molybdenum cofactor biosynthesis protein MoaE [Vicinamibacterales bacterium]